MLGMKRGDTIVEVIVAFAVFALVSVGAITVMNRGVAMTERSLEITLVREQMDAQAQLLRYARDADLPIWQTIRDDSIATGTGGSSCPITGNLITPPSQAFIVSVNGGTLSHTRFSAVSGSFLQPTTYSQFTLEAAPKSYGLWVVPVRVEGASNSYDMYIRACWYAPGDTVPTTLGTIVRLYET